MSLNFVLSHKSYSSSCFWETCKIGDFGQFGDFSSNIAWMCNPKNAQISPLELDRAISSYYMWNSTIFWEKKEVKKVKKKGNAPGSDLYEK